MMLPEELSPMIIFGVVQVTAPPMTQGGRHPASHSSALGEEHFAAAHLLPGDRPSQEAKAEALRKLETSVPTSQRIVWAVIALMPGTFVRSTPKIR